MRIIELRTTNYKNARHVEIKPDPNGNLVYVAGNNGAGKSSVLDSIAAALGGANSKNTPKPIRDGADRAEIVLETEGLKVTRRFTPSGSTLTVASKDGAKFTKGQAKLDELVGKLSMDPFAFTQLDDKKQVQQLLDLVDLPFDPEQLEAERKSVFDDRTAVNRQVKELEAQLQGYVELPENLPAAEVSVAELLNEYREAENMARLQQVDHDHLAEMNQSIDRINEQIANLIDQRKHLEASRDSARIRISDHVDLPDLAGIQSRIDTAEGTNRLVRKAKDREALKERLATVKNQSQELTNKLDKIAADKAEGLAYAKFPVPGLGFDENGVTYNGQPFKQASTAEQIRVSMAMAIALNPTMRVIRITDGSLLDQNSLALVESMANKHDMQVWLEIVGEGPDGAYTIIDGEVA